MAIYVSNSNEIQDNVLHLKDTPDNLKCEHVSQMVYGLIKQDPSNSQRPDQLAHIYSIIHEIDFNKYMEGLLRKDRNVISIMVTEVYNALETVGIFVDMDQLASMFLYGGQ